MKKVIVLASLTPFLAHSQDLLEPLVVTANRSKLPLSDSAYTSSYLDNDFFSEYTRRNIPDALTFTPGVLSQKTTYGHGSPFIRGMTGRSNLLLLDGVRMNNSTWRSGPVQYWNTLDSYSVDHLELIKSQGSVPFGSDAIGGTLTAFSKSSNYRDEAKGAFFTHGSTYYEYRSNGEDSHIGRIEGDIGQGGIWGLKAGITMKDFGDIHDSAIGTMQNTGYEENDWDLRFDMLLNPSTTLTMAYQATEQDDVWRWHRTTLNPGWNHDGHVSAAGTWLENSYDQERSLGYIRISSEDPQVGAWLSRWSATLSYQQTAESEFQDRRSAASQSLSSTRYQQLQLNDIDTYGIDLEFESPMGPGKWIYGMDYYQDEVDTNAIRNKGAGYVFQPGSRPVADDSSYQLFGLHSQYHWQATDKLRIESGARYTHARAEIGKRWDSNILADVSSEREWDNTVFSVRAIQELPHSWSLYGGVSQAFRAPNLADLSGSTTSRSGVETGGSVNLNPEDYVTYEIGARHSDDNTWFNAAIFYTDIENIITDVPVSMGSTTTQADNGRNGFLYGFEIEAAWQINDQWTLSGFAGWQEGETETLAYEGGPQVTDPYSRALPLTASISLRWTNSSQKYWIEGRVLAAEEADRLSLADKGDNQRFPTNGTPGYVVPMVYAGCKATENLDLTLGLENISNIDYRSHGSGNNEPGFNAIIGIKANW
jgi:hemoglobin/transferrin/lactoferrin receptor protein